MPQEMGLTVVGLYAIGLIGECSALPIQSVNTGDRNVVLLGALMFLSFGAVIAGCVCCRRRKKGFEEFRNESGTPEATKTEYPIFRALSPDSQRHQQIAAPAVGNSNENLIEDDLDNNNGPISPADLENIENNNAVDYIQNQNEVGITIEPSPYAINRNLVPTASPSNVDNTEFSQSSSLPLPELQDVNITSAMSSLRVEQHQIQYPSSDIQLEAIVIDNVGGMVNEQHPKSGVEEESVVRMIQNSTFASPNVLNSEARVQIHSIHSLNDEEQKEEIMYGPHITWPIVHVIEGNIEEPEEEQNDAANADEALSIKSGSSARSSEINSVEEALRALDCAIAGENSLHSGGDDEEDVDGEEFECDNADFHNVIRQLLINNGVKSILPDLKDDHLYGNLIKLNDFDGVRTEAEMLVDSILNESKKFVEEKDLTYNNQTVIIQNCEINDNKLVYIKKEDKSKELESCTYSPTVLTPSESVEDFFSFTPLDKTSTPCAFNKHASYKSSAFAFPSAGVLEAKVRKNILESEEDIATSPLEMKKVEDVILNETVTIKENTDSPNIADGTFTFPKTDATTVCNQTFVADKTFHVQSPLLEDACKEYTHPGDPCTSKQALERDNCYPSIVYDHEEANSEDMTTVTPVNTPIELNYSNEMWNRLTKGVELDVNKDEEGTTSSNDNGFTNTGWFLHPQTSNIPDNETFDMDGQEEDEANLESTFEALRKQLAEVLPQPQGITGPAEYSDEEDENPQNRTFDEYRSPLDGLIGLFEGDPIPGTTVQNEMFIKYKRMLTPILEESEEETCKTFVMNEMKCLDSTSTGCVDTGEAIMGVSKALMASNDTLFNFEDTLGEREDVFSPRTPTRSETQLNASIKSGKSTAENSTATLDSDKFDSNNSDKGTHHEEHNHQGRRSPPKTIDIPTSTEMMIDGDVCSPEQQKTFSEETNSSNTDRISSDVSGTIDHDTTFATYTNDEKTCITVIVKDDERISEISEPEWGSTTSYGGYEMNSLTDIPSLDYNVNNFEDKSESNNESSNSSDAISRNSKVDTNVTLQTAVENNLSGEDNQQEDSGNSTQLSTDDRTINSDHSFEDETQKCNREMSETVVINDNNDLMTQSQSSPSKSFSLHDTNLDDREQCRNFIYNEIAISSSQNLYYDASTEMKFTNETLDREDRDRNESFDFDSSKENKNPNIKEEQYLQSQLTLSPNTIDFDFDKHISTISYQKVQTNSQDAVIIDKKSKLNSVDRSHENVDLKNGGMHENIFYKPETTILPNKQQQTIANYSVSDVSVNGVHNEQHCFLVADEIIAHLSGEEDPWAEPLHNDIHFVGPCSEIITSFTNEWDSDVDDSHSSEEFMYVRGTPTKENLSEIIKKQSEKVGQKNINGHDFFEYEGLNDTDVWSTHADKIPVADSAEDEISEGSSSEFEGEFVPSCWDSMATPARSALKSPDKSSSPSKKRRNVAFKKQRYHSVYEYPRENASLSPSYSEPYLYSRGNGSIYFERDSKEEFNDGFTVSSSMRPFHGSQFNALCHTWPTDSDFSWSQVEDLGDISNDKKLSAYANTTNGKWPHTFDSIDLTDSDMKTENLEYYGNNRPDSGVGESAEMLSDRLPLGELCHTKSSLRLPLELLPPAESLPETKTESKKLNESLVDRLILPTPSCTGSMDSISSSSGSERQVSFSTFGKSNNSTLTNTEINENKRSCSNTIAVSNSEQLKPALILIENGPIEFSLGPDKIKQSDSTDEDSGIESIMKVNKESD